MRSGPDYTSTYIVIAKNIVSNFSEIKAFRPIFWVLFVRKYSKLSKFIQKIVPNARMPRIFMDSVEKSAFYIYAFSPNILL